MFRLLPWRSSILNLAFKNTSNDTEKERNLQWILILIILITLIISQYLIAELGYREALMQAAHCAQFFLLYTSDVHIQINKMLESEGQYLCFTIFVPTPTSTQQAHSQQLSAHKLLCITHLHQYHCFHQDGDVGLCEVSFE